MLHTVVLRLGALLVLMLTMGNWSDVLHVLFSFLGEAVCLLPSQDLLKAALQVFKTLLFQKYILIPLFAILDLLYSSIEILKLHLTVMFHF